MAYIKKTNTINNIKRIIIIIAFQFLIFGKNTAAILVNIGNPFFGLDKPSSTPEARKCWPLLGSKTTTEALLVPLKLTFTEPTCLDCETFFSIYHTDESKQLQEELSLSEINPSDRNLCLVIFTSEQMPEHSSPLENLLWCATKIIHDCLMNPLNLDFTGDFNETGPMAKALMYKICQIDGFKEYFAGYCQKNPLQMDRLERLKLILQEINASKGCQECGGAKDFKDKCNKCRANELIKHQCAYASDIFEEISKSKILPDDAFANSVAPDQVILVLLGEFQIENHPDEEYRPGFPVFFEDTTKITSVGKETHQTQSMNYESMGFGGLCIYEGVRFIMPNNLEKTEGVYVLEYQKFLEYYRSRQSNEYRKKALNSSMPLSSNSCRPFDSNAYTIVFVTNDAKHKSPELQNTTDPNKLIRSALTQIVYNAVTKPLSIKHGGIYRAPNIESLMDKMMMGFIDLEIGVKFMQSPLPNSYTEELQIMTKYLTPDKQCETKRERIRLGVYSGTNPCCTVQTSICSNLDPNFWVCHDCWPNCQRMKQFEYAMHILDYLRRKILPVDAFVSPKSEQKCILVPCNPDDHDHMYFLDTPANILQIGLKGCGNVIIMATWFPDLPPKGEIHVVTPLALQEICNRPESLLLQEGLEDNSESDFEDPQPDSSLSDIKTLHPKSLCVVVCANSKLRSINDPETSLNMYLAMIICGFVFNPLEGKINPENFEKILPNLKHFVKKLYTISGFEEFFIGYVDSRYGWDIFSQQHLRLLESKAKEFMPQGCQSFADQKAYLLLASSSEFYNYILYSCAAELCKAVLSRTSAHKRKRLEVLNGHEVNPEHENKRLKGE